jgi:HemY protein
MPVSPVSGRIDAFEWRVPLAEIAQTGSDFDLAKDAPALVEEKPAVPPASAEPALTIETAPPVAASQPVRQSAQPVRPRGDDIVVPTVHVPDDPGPGPDMEREPIPEPTAAASGWRRFFSW